MIMEAHPTGMGSFSAENVATASGSGGGGVLAYYLMTSHTPGIDLQSLPVLLVRFEVCNLHNCPTTKQLQIHLVQKHFSHSV